MVRSSCGWLIMVKLPYSVTMEKLLPPARNKIRTTFCRRALLETGVPGGVLFCAALPVLYIGTGNVHKVLRIFCTSMVAAAGGEGYNRAVPKENTYTGCRTGVRRKSGGNNYEKAHSSFLYHRLRRSCCCRCPHRLRRRSILCLYRSFYCRVHRFFRSAGCRHPVRQRCYRRFHFHEERHCRSHRGLC